MSADSTTPASTTYSSATATLTNSGYKASYCHDSPLSHLFPDSPELDSPLARICRQLDVGPFLPDVARAFLAHRLRGTGVAFAESEIAALLRETNGHAAKLQRAAADLFKTRQVS